MSESSAPLIGRVGNHSNIACDFSYFHAVFPGDLAKRALRLYLKACHFCLARSLPLISISISRALAFSRGMSRARSARDSVWERPLSNGVPKACPNEVARPVF